MCNVYFLSLVRVMRTKSKLMLKNVNKSLLFLKQKSQSHWIYICYDNLCAMYIRGYCKITVFCIKNIKDYDKLICLKTHLLLKTDDQMSCIIFIFKN